MDYPGKVAASVFLPGCNLRCPFCHNPELVLPPFDEGLLPWEEILTYLERRRNLLEGVCISGGEPLLHPGLPDLIARIHGLGLPVKLDTNGTLPEALAAAGADYVAMDLKTAPERYPELAGPEVSETFRTSLPSRIGSSIGYLIESNTPHEFRTTAVPGIVDSDDIRKICSWIRGGGSYTIAQFRNGRTLSAEYRERLPYDPATLRTLARTAEGCGVPCRIRGN